VNDYERQLLVRQRIAEDRDMINAGARLLRHRVRGEMLAGLGRPEVCFQLAGVLDEIALHVTTVPQRVREQAVRAAAGLVERVGPDQG
jgi:hypothetical protein